MTKIFNDCCEPAEEALAGFCDVHSGLVRQVPGGAGVGSIFSSPSAQQA